MLLSSSSAFLASIFLPLTASSHSVIEVVVDIGLRRADGRIRSANGNTQLHLTPLGSQPQPPRHRDRFRRHAAAPRPTWHGSHWLGRAGRGLKTPPPRGLEPGMRPLVGSFAAEAACGTPRAASADNGQNGCLATLPHSSETSEVAPHAGEIWLLV